jgi:hypothetical protein
MLVPAAANHTLRHCFGHGVRFRLAVVAAAISVTPKTAPSATAPALRLRATFFMRFMVFSWICRTGRRLRRRPYRPCDQDAPPALRKAMKGL